MQISKVCLVMLDSEVALHDLESLC
jgi:hypothetical protein